VKTFGPVKELFIGFAVTGYMVYKIPVTQEMRDNSST
jgi:hypothetical protein